MQCKAISNHCPFPVMQKQLRSPPTYHYVRSFDVCSNWLNYSLGGWVFLYAESREYWQSRQVGQPLREIVLFILDNHQGILSDIASYTGKSISKVSSHLGKLKQEEIISTRRSGQGFLFSLANPELVANVALKYKLRKIDKSVNNFIDMVDQLWAFTTFPSKQ